MTRARDEKLRVAQKLLQELFDEEGRATVAEGALSAADEEELRARALAATARLRSVQRDVDRAEQVGSQRSRRVSRKGGQRILGPYEEVDGWRVIEVDAAGKRRGSKFDSEGRAQRYAEILRADLSCAEQTTETAIAEYRGFLNTKGNKPYSVEQTCRVVAQFFVSAIPLSLLSVKRCESLYAELCRRPSERTKKPPAADSQRNALSQVKTFLAWCVERGWIRENPAAHIKGIGKRRPRGKSLGKSGVELRVREARAWFGMAVFKAHRGDQGAVAALVALLLGMRASEIVSRRVADLDEDQAPGDLLWIPCSKTPAGRRTLEVPDVLRQYLVACCKDKAGDRYIFEANDHKPHWRDWILHNVHRICDLAEVPRVTAHAMRGLLATITAERGLAGHVIAATLGHEDERVTMNAYARPGAAEAGVQRRGLVVLSGGKRTG